MRKSRFVCFAVGAAGVLSALSPPVSAQPYASPYHAGPQRLLQPVDPYVVERVEVSSSEDHGTYLTDGDGRALYMFTADRRGGGARPPASECYGPCMKQWPPAYSVGPVAAGRFVDRSKLGVFRRADGMRQVAYNGWPLYYYAGDLGAAETQGQDMESFGGEWYLLSSQGMVIE